jgi:hypothetical protein
MDINSIISSINKLFSSVKTPAPEVPSELLLVGAKIRSGLSPSDIASRIIERQAEAGAAFGPMPDGSANVMEAMWRIAIEEIVNEIIENSKVDIVIPPNSISIISNGANAGGPMVSIGTNELPVSGIGTLR